MTAHVIFTQIDSAPATLSAPVIAKVIRERIGFKGLLMTDDISMGALSGSLRDRAGGAVGAGCDLVLHCNGRLEEMTEIAASVPELAGESLQRAEAALAARIVPEPVERGPLEARFDQLLSQAVA
jgi:beta-N-acetylhexosaminidase